MRLDPLRTCNTNRRCKERRAGGNARRGVSRATSASCSLDSSMRRSSCRVGPASLRAQTHRETQWWVCAAKPGLTHPTRASSLIWCSGRARLLPSPSCPGSAGASPSQNTTHMFRLDAPLRTHCQPNTPRHLGEQQHARRRRGDHQPVYRAERFDVEDRPAEASRSRTWPTTVSDAISQELRVREQPVKSRFRRRTASGS